MGDCDERRLQATQLRGHPIRNVLFEGRMLQDLRKIYTTYTQEGERVWIRLIQKQHEVKHTRLSLWKKYHDKAL